MASLAELTDNPFVQNTIDSVALRDATDLPKTRIIVRPQNTPDNEPIKQDDSKLQNIIDQLFGLNGKERYQLWPEKLVRDAISAPHDVMTGEIPQYVIDPVTGEAQTSPQMIKAGVDTSSLAGSGGLAGAGSEAGVALGSAPFLRPALKYGEKLYKGKPGQQHMDVIPADLYPTFQKQAMSGEDISNFNFGFLNHKGQFLSRKDALKYAIDNGLVDPHSAQYGALTSTLMSDTAKPGAALAAVANTNKPFYSAVENAVAAAKQPKADAQQWLSFLKNQPGVKQEELAHLGLDKLQGPISKDDLLKAVQEGQPQIKEVIKTNRDTGEIQRDPDGTILPTTQETKYHSYQLPGGENYREMLLTLPEKRDFKPLTSNDFKRLKELDNELANAKDADVPRLMKEQNDLYDRVEQSKNYSPLTPYKSSHWDEPNVLAHIRMNDRTIDGKKSLHLEEIQSDWHQEGRKKGYKPSEDLKSINDEIKNIDIKLKSIKQSSDEINPHNLYDSNAEFKALANQRKALYEKVEAHTTGVPDAPFKKTWDELALKKAITEAVKNGYDQISWTPGEAQAARYDLSKQVDKIAIPMVNKDGARSVRVDAKGSSPFKLMVNKDGMVEGHGSSSSQFSGKPLSDIVGKEMADKIMKLEKPDEFSGDGLKIGGQGMKAFYDKMLVDKANALVKKHGGKVEQKDLNDVGEKFAYINNKSGNKGPAFDTQAEAKEWAKTNNINLDNVTLLQVNRRAKEGVSKQLVHVLKITPELREHVLKKGFPLFSAGVPVFTPVDHDPFKEMNK